MEDFEIEEQDGGLPILIRKEATTDGLPILKKKVDGEHSVSGTRPSSQSSSSFDSTLQSGQEIASGQAFKNVTSTPFKEAAQKDKDRNQSYLGAVWNNIVGSAERLAGGAARLADKFENNPAADAEKKALDIASQTMGVNLRAVREKEISDKFKNFIGKAKTNASSEEHRDKLLSGFDVTNGVGVDDLKALGVMLPAMVGDMAAAVPTAGSSFLIQGYDDALSTIDKMPEAKNMKESTRTAFGIGGGIVAGVLEKLGLDNILKSGTTTRYVTAKVIKETAEELAKKGAKVTAEELEQAVAAKATDLLKNSALKNAVKAGGKSALIEGATEATQEGAMDLLKIAANKLEDKDIFDTKEMKNTAASRYLNNAVVGGLMGGVAGGAFSRMKNLERHVQDQVKEAKTQEDIDRITSEINQNVQDGTISEDEGRKLITVIKPEDNKAVAAITISPKEQSINEIQIENNNIVPREKIEVPRTLLEQDVQKNKIQQPEQTEGTPIAETNQNIGSAEKVPFEQFKADQLDNIANIKDSSFDWRTTMDISQAEREKGVKDIRDGKDTAAARKVNQAIQDMYDKGVITMNRGRGTQVETRDFTFEELGHLQKEIPGIDKHIQDWMNEQADIHPDREQIVNDNIDEIIHYYENEQGKTEKPIPGSKSQSSEQVGTTDSGKRNEEKATTDPTNQTIGVTSVTEPELIGVSHAETDKVAKELGLPEYETKPETIEQWDKEADERIKNDPDTVSKLLTKLKKGEKPEAVEQRIMLKYLASLKAKINADPLNSKLISEFKNAKELSDIVGGREVGKSLRARQELIPVEDSLADSMVREMEVSGVDELTDAQKEKVVSEHEALTKSKEEAEAKLKILEEENAKLKAEAELRKTTKSTTAKKKSKEDIAKVRETLKESIKDKWKKAANDGTLTAVPLPYAKQLAAIAPDVSKLVRSYVEEGVTNLGEVVKKVIDDIREFIPEITEKDVHDIIAGEYNKKKQTKNELSAKVKDLKDEAALINKLERLLSGTESKNEKAKVERNRQIKELQDKIKNYKSEESEAGKFYGESESGNIKLQKLEDELDRVRSRRTKESVKRDSKEDIEISVREKSLLNEIEAEQAKWDAEKEASKVAKSEYRRLETERNRQLERVAALSKKLESLKEGNLPEKGKRENKPDTPEIDGLKEEIKASEKFVRSAIATQKRIASMEAELERLKNRADKEPTQVNKRAVTDKEIELKQNIEEERKSIRQEEAEANKFYTEDVPEDLKKLKSTRKRLESQAKDVQEKINKGEYEPEVKKTVPILENKELQKKFPKEYKEALAAQDALIKLNQEREVRLLKQQYANRSKSDKVKDAALEVLNVPRALMSSFDFSAPLRQGIIPTVSHPLTAVKAAGQMFSHAFSQKRFDRWFDTLRKSEDFKVMDKSGLYVSDPHNYKLTAKEEQFMNNLAEKIPVIGKLVKGSERAYVSYLNKMRVDLFENGKEVLEAAGKTPENSPKDYQGLASWINNSTGRGGMTDKLENASPILNSMFFSPRLIASRLNILGLSDVVSGGNGFYSKLPKEVRMMAARDLTKFVGFTLSMLSLAAIGGADVETDPRSSDFAKIRVGDTRYDIFGGFQQYIRFIAQMITGKTKSSTTGRIKQLNGKQLFGKTRADVALSFLRGKLAPVPSMAYDFAQGRKPTGEKTTFTDEMLSHFTPLIYSDLKEAVKKDGAEALFTVGLPATFGVGVQTYDSKKKKMNGTGGGGAAGNF